MNFKGKVVLVTGASRGIGAAIAQAFAQEGAMVVVNYLQNATAAQAVVEQCQHAGGDAWAVFLVKPQFEVGPLGVARGGIVRDDALRQAALADVSEWVNAQGWAALGSMESPITGGDGNHEYLLAARRR